MPPKKKITKKKILKIALDIVRKHGIESISARSIAKKLECSPQPIYSVFKNMNELEKAVIEEANRFVTQKYFSNNNQENGFINMGLGSIEMAREEKNIYHLLYHSGKIALNFEDTIYPFDIRGVISGMKYVPELSDLDEKVLERIFFNMWVYTHGLASIVMSNPSINKDKIVSALEAMGDIVIGWEIIKKKER